MTRSDVVMAEALAALANFTCRAVREDLLQEAIAERLEPLGFLREHHLDHLNRPDFFHPDGVAVEVKVDGSRYVVARQLARYLRHQDVDYVLLVTTRYGHLRLVDADPRCRAQLVRGWP